ncbi:Predicted transglutaminase-like cysteine proteinase [Methylobacterium sp. 174MFSha1.1]|uniref:transglutaminase-like cysteine peptidase n=1 Tax=Methylobacterium sp. 174MFSha1.1 TaxID=1502749 RepID=UPI0008F286AF|nr:transglutaminase-like cysteine peptidase [Methylobacterium sp. 174MFSha1.1]SFV16620.1 Predicted transglutaminase-like cysteine proteinase [Methylobacterium sp. 174MFSha1.1]
MRIAGRTGGIGIARVLAVAAGLMASASGAGSQTLAALPAVTIPAATVGEARPVPAWTEFCARYASECAVDASEPAQVTLTPRLWQTVTGINRQVNTSLRAVTDQEHWGVPDRWDLAEDGSGDCEDFQLLKRKLLAQAGLPRRAMRMTVVIDEKGEGHAVLMLRTDRGDLVLDNKTSAVLPWHKTGYTFIKREGDESTRWVSLGRAVSPVVTANR